MAEQEAPDDARELAVVLHDLAWLLPRTVDRRVDGEFDRLPASELEVMRLLVRRPGLNVGEVSRELGIKQSNCSVAVRSLLARGLLERSRDPGDGRVTRLVPTARATDDRRRREAAWGKALEAELARLSPRTAARLRACAPALRALAQELSAPEE